MSCLPDPKNPKFRQDLSTRGYRVQNLFEELDADGEFYIDRKSGIFYVALSSEPSGTLEFSALAEPILAFKNFDGAEVRNVKFGPSRGMGIYINSSRNIKIDSCEFSNFGTVAVSAGSAFSQNPPAKLRNAKPRFKFNSAISLENCKIHEQRLRRRLHKRRRQARPPAVGQPGTQLRILPQLPRGAEILPFALALRRRRARRQLPLPRRPVQHAAIRRQRPRHRKEQV